MAGPSATDAISCDGGAQVAAAEMTPERAARDTLIMNGDIKFKIRAPSWWVIALRLPTALESSDDRKT